MGRTPMMQFIFSQSAISLFLVNKTLKWKETPPPPIKTF